MPQQRMAETMRQGLAGTEQCLHAWGKDTNDQTPGGTSGQPPSLEKNDLGPEASVFSPPTLMPGYYSTLECKCHTKRKEQKGNL